MYIIEVPWRPEMHYTCLNIAPIMMIIIGRLMGEITSMLMAMKILALSMTYLIWIAITNLAHVNHFEKKHYMNCRRASLFKVKMRRFPHFTNSALGKSLWMCKQIQLMFQIFEQCRCRSKMKGCGNHTIKNCD